MTPIEDLDLVHRAFTTGYEEGYARGRQEASEDLARDWLHQESLRHIRMAMATAIPKGRSWTQAILEQSRIDPTGIAGPSTEENAHSLEEYLASLADEPLYGKDWPDSSADVYDENGQKRG